MPAICLPPVIEEALDRGAALALNLSGGKDSRAMWEAVLAEWERRQWKGDLLAIHCDLGEMDWAEARYECEAWAKQRGVRYVCVERPLMPLMRAQLERNTPLGKPWAPSTQARYCTSFCKRGGADLILRQYKLAVSAEGIRWQESPARARKQVVEVRKSITTTVDKLHEATPEDALAEMARWSAGDKRRVALTWRPIISWKLDEDVWPMCGTSSEDVARRRELYRAGHHAEAMRGWPLPPAYVWGTSRYSCCFCPLATENDLTVAAYHRPATCHKLSGWEDESGYSMKNGLWLRDLRPDEYYSRKCAAGEAETEAEAAAELEC